MENSSSLNLPKKYNNSCGAMIDSSRQNILRWIKYILPIAFLFSMRMRARTNPSIYYTTRNNFCCLSVNSSRAEEFTDCCVSALKSLSFLLPSASSPLLSFVYFCSIFSVSIHLCTHRFLHALSHHQKVLRTCRLSLLSHLLRTRFKNKSTSNSPTTKNVQKSEEKASEPTEEKW